MTSPDIPSLITKLRNAPQLVGTFGRGDPDPQDEYRPGMTGEERDSPLYPGGIDDIEI
jgi:hypothetical protein